MKATRIMFILTGNQADIQQVLDNVHFQGLVALNLQDVSLNNILQIFSNNKSVIFPLVSSLNYDHADVIYIAVGNKDMFSSHDVDYINVSQGNISNQLQKIADIHNCDIGISKSNSSDLDRAPLIEDCAYCNRFKGIDPYNQPFFYQSPNFFAMPTLGQFITGYPLIISKKHLMSCAEFDYETMEEFLEVLDDILLILKITYHTSDFLIWENVTMNDGDGDSSHFHIQIAPSKLTADMIEAIMGVPLKKISTLEIPQYAKHSYLLIKDGDDWRINYNPSVYIPRQYVRQLLAMEYRIPDELWNWKKYPFTDKIQQTYQDINHAIKLNLDFLPDRIKSRVITM